MVVVHGWQSKPLMDPKVSEALSLVPLSPSLSLSLARDDFLSTYLSLCVSICLYLSTCLPLFLSISLSFYLSISLSIYRSIDRSICVSIDLSIYLSVYLSKYLSIYLYIYLNLDLPKSICIFLNHSSSTAQGGGGSFKNRKPIREVGCCESRMAERRH